MFDTRTVGAYEAKTNLSALLEFVVEGNEVVITKHDRPIARLVPVNAPVDRGQVFDRLRALRSGLRLAPGESPKDMVSAGRRI